VFRELDLIEQWGSGLNRINESCIQHGAAPPKFEELDLFFRVTLYPRTAQAKPQHPWYSLLFAHIHQHNQISVIEAGKLWNVSSRTATKRLKLLCQEGLLTEVSKGPFDPHKAFILSKPGSSIK
jgi:ATP-dependent DNA helicase RecG